MSNSLDPDQAQRFVGSDLGPNCLQKLSADDTRGNFCPYAISTKILSAVSNIYFTEHLNEYSTIKMMKIDGVILLTVWSN